MVAGLDFDVLRQKETWQAFGVGVVLFCIIGYSSLTLFGLSASAYGVSDDIELVPDFEVATMNRTGIDDVIADDSGMVQLSDLRGSVIILDFMAVDCSNCHYVQTHIESRELADARRTIRGIGPVNRILVWLRDFQRHQYDLWRFEFRQAHAVASR